MMELPARLSVLDTLLGESDLRGALRRGIINLSNRHPRTWMAFTAMVAGAGYALVLLFPYFLVSTGRIVYPVLMSGQVPQDWPLFVSQVCSLLISAAFTYTLLTMRFAPPGRVLTREEAPLLFGLVERLRQSSGNPRIHQLI
ncbi:MAG TPA: hypothetical protein VKA13_03245, partial [Gammaproteobacteria bacterium]|nr:hypothetical protein [Gammaproteobacteria bacterium]